MLLAVYGDDDDDDDDEKFQYSTGPKTPKPMHLHHGPLRVLYSTEFPIVIVYLIIILSIEMKHSVLKSIHT